MLLRRTCLSILLLLTICQGLFGDTLRLKGIEGRINAKIIEVNEESIKVTIPQNVIGGVSMKSENDDKYPDSILINSQGGKNKVVCKIINVTKAPASITIRVPRQIVAAMQMSFPGSENDNTKNEGKVYTTIDPEKLAKRIKDELRREFEKKYEEKGVRKEGPDELASRIKEELKLEFEKDELEEERVYAETNFGQVKGRMLRNGKPLPLCQVKILKLDKWGITSNYKQGLTFETTTDDRGIYIIRKVPSGGYKLHWKPPGETSWIRKIKMEPDFFVEVGEVHYVPDRETKVRTVN